MSRIGHESQQGPAQLALEALSSVAPVEAGSAVQFASIDEVMSA